MCICYVPPGGMQALEWIMLGQELDLATQNTAATTSTDTTDTTENAGSNNPAPSLDETPHPFIRSAVVIGCGARHTAWQIAFSELQRQAIYNDPLWNGGDYDSR